MYLYTFEPSMLFLIFRIHLCCYFSRNLKKKVQNSAFGEFVYFLTFPAFPGKFRILTFLFFGDFVVYFSTFPGKFGIITFQSS